MTRMLHGDPGPTGTALEDEVAHVYPTGPDVVS